MSIRTIKTPKGKFISPRWYLHLHTVRSDSDFASENNCEHGHLGCAAWEAGPCFDEVLSAVEENVAIGFDGQHAVYYTDQAPA